MTTRKEIGAQRAYSPSPGSRSAQTKTPGIVSATLSLGAAFTLLVVALTVDSVDVRLVVIAGTALLAFALRASPTLIYCLALAATMASDSWVFADGTVSIALRGATVALLGVLGLYRFSTASPHAQTPASGAAPRAMRTLALGTWLMLTLIALVHRDLSLAVNSTLGFIALLGLIHFPLSTIGLAKARAGLAAILTAYLGISLAVGLAFPQKGVVNERMTGIATNPNLLGFFALLTVAVAVLTRVSRMTSVVLLLVALPVFTLTASRSSAIGAVILIATAALVRVRKARFFLGATALVVLLVVLSFGIPTSLRDGALFRYNNSRQGSFDEALRLYDRSPFLGAGMDSIQETIASSPLRALAAGGLLALAILIVNLVVLLIRSGRIGPATLSLTVAALIHSFGEGWLVSTSGPMILLFTMTWLIVAGEEEASRATLDGSSRSVQRGRFGRPG